METIRDVALGDLPATLEKHANGTYYVRCQILLPPVAIRLTDRLDHWAEQTPDRIFLAQRQADQNWRLVTYQQARDLVRHLASALLLRKLSVERPLVVLSGNDIEQGLLSLACMLVGVPFVPVSPAYSLISTDYDKLRTILAKVTPGMIFVSTTTPFAKAISATVDRSVELVYIGFDWSAQRCHQYATHALCQSGHAGPFSCARGQRTTGLG